MKNYSSYTIANREYYLYCFLEWAGQRGLVRPTEITKPILERYQRHLFYYRKANGNPLSIQDQYNRSVALRHWFKWLTKQNYLLYNPASELELPKVEKRLPRAILTETEAENVLHQPDVTTPMGLRDRAMLGHVDLSTTEIYTQVSIKKLKAVHTLTHPAKSRRKKIQPAEEPLIPTEEDIFIRLAEEESLDPE